MSKWMLLVMLLKVVRFILLQHTHLLNKNKPRSTKKYNLNEKKIKQKNDEKDTQ